MQLIKASDVSRNLQGPGRLEIGSEAPALGGSVAAALPIWKALDAGLITAP